VGEDSGKEKKFLSKSSLLRQKWRLFLARSFLNGCGRREKSIEWHIPWLMCCYCCCCSVIAAATCNVEEPLSTLICANIRPFEPPGFDTDKTEIQKEKNRKIMGARSTDQ
jgi:hypothetical protein